MGFFDGRARRAAAACVALCTLALAACNGGGPSPLAGTPERTIAFESIDGPPAGVFTKLVDRLSDEAQTRQIAVVSREGPAQFRARGYLAIFVHGGRTSVGWVWDVYDSSRNRAVRITGEEPGGRGGRDPWAVADDAMLRRIARASMERLAAFLAAPDALPADGSVVVAEPAPVVPTRPSLAATPRAVALVPATR